MRKLITRKRLFVTLLITGLAIGGYFIYTNQAKYKILSQSKTQTLTAKVQRGTLKDSVSSSGQIESANYLPVTTAVNGIVEKVYVKEGEVVSKGQKLMSVTLNSDGQESLSQAWNTYLSAKNSLDSANNKLYALESALINATESFDTEKEGNSYQTHDERVSYKLAENTYLTAKADYESQENSIQQAKASLNKAWLAYQAASPQILAPESGTIANIVVVEGMDIANSLSERTSATVASIKREGTPIASLNVSEVDINKISVSQTVYLTLNSLPKQTFNGKVVGIDKIGTVSSGVSNYPVIVKFDAEQDKVLPNMGVDGDIVIAEKQDVLYVPTSAITTRKGETSVKVKKGEQFVDTKVEMGIKTTDFTEILSGVSEGEEVVINSLPTSGFTTTSPQTNRQGGGFIPGFGR
ncbi:hypothetical protein A3K34_01590 [candidate division WWE3 bacterium RIFOXYC1_FULL_40_10]|uniref:CzcB-like C-terminal circularly permuted SH3-like domain-containing protein n=1 Tax=candidate division WWE3 bacterium RIFOXYA2_FULL_46_9 TaxID=1802636 RepID=A0A1F4W2G0_UNCKA|nr:MAG: hypothetical protein A3K58_01590 [candidate division WWE3 bacterium RIFOXYB1_FULL_40_22]OGC61558.1 MAG: hypothetical protein A3K37_01590 [candidate division WWE3 bacterium RIFOXYA1_FULL_40_11]OGC63604.1 MAG: hypothetical protein A2264_04530 [candidate division WWE3 bacterium RIFOXYA2_FULL_46_9]OGC64763.1 MAG: hypothetical protein A2326_01865 [candidate division WWE3 bacterium RIFOXYB2_FULL_41_6]OGC65941.1 MAG: hypothetical protein A3K34_01590 [candidate division WWE3 bacterium RIFOXYC1_